MARRRRLSKPLLPGLWSVLAALVLMGGIAGVFWVLGKSTRLTRISPTPPPAPSVAKRK